MEQNLNMNQREIDIEKIIEAITPAIKQTVLLHINDEEIFRIIKEEVLRETEKTIKETIAEIVMEALKKKLSR